MSAINVAFTKLAGPDELCSAMICETKDIAVFAKENQMFLDGDPKLDSPEGRRYAPHEVPIGISEIRLYNSTHDFGQTFDALMDLSEGMRPGEGINRMIELLMLEAFKAGAKWQAEKKVKPIAIVP